MRIRLFAICCLGFFSTLSFAQKVMKVRAEYTFYAPSNVTLDEAKHIALERAKVQIIAETFGTVVSQNNTTFVRNQNGNSEIDFLSMGGSEVKGEWIETIGEPVYDIAYEQGMLIVKVSVNGRIREIITPQINFTAKVLRNGTDEKFEDSNFKVGDDLYFYFKSPVSGYLSLYLLDELTQTVYCLLPYKYSDEPIVAIEHDIPYVFFSPQHADGISPSMVDEYTMTCNHEKESNTIYVIFSPNRYVKANSSNMEDLLPRQLSFEEFQKWLVKYRNQDKDMNVIRKTIIIEN